MSRPRIPRTLWDPIAHEAHRRCGYCLTAEAIVGSPMEIDHIIPQSRGGSSMIDNLWLACALCNSHKGDRITAIDPETGEVERLFDPRRQVWREHSRGAPRAIGFSDAPRGDGQPSLP